MANKNKNILSRQTENKKTFSYQKGNTTLNFTLNVDNKGEMKDFLEVLLTAEKDVLDEIERK